jgi:hypothetical protein
MKSIKPVIKSKKYKSGFDNVEFSRLSGLGSEPHLDWMYSSEKLSVDDCNEIIRVCREFPLMEPSTVEEELYPKHRLADVRKVQLNSSTNWLFEFLCLVAEESNRQGSNIKLTEISREPQYVEYAPNWGQFDWHNDYSHGLPEAPRKLTIIIQLSAPEDYEGGSLQVLGPTIQNLPTEFGTILTFPSFLMHRVTPVTKGLRRALVAWIAGPRIG